MSRSYRKRANHLGGTNSSFWGKREYEPGKFFEFRHPRNNRHALREVSKKELFFRKKSIPPDTTADQFAKGRLQTGWR